MASPYTVADHLLDRLAELGVDRIFGVPGDFTLGFLDHIDAHPTIEWIGTANELGAGYAADGYARVRGIGVVCTTFGVGELSAINTVAGSYAEHVGVLHLVDSPATTVQAAGRPSHHTLGGGDFQHTLRLTAEVTVAQSLLSADDAVDEIDRVLVAIVQRNQPGYLSVPSDVGELPAAPPTAALPVALRTSDADALAGFTDAARALLRDAPAPVVLADVLVNRAHAEAALHELIATGGLRHATLLWGRRVVDETGQGYLGTYVGAASDPAVGAAVEGAVVAGVTFPDVEMAEALTVLAGLVEPAAPPGAGPPSVPNDPPSGSPAPPDRDDTLNQTALWDFVAAALQPGDLVVADQGTSFYGLGPHRLPHDALFIGQPLWAAIGYTLPAILGAAIAAPQRRPVLLIGDGAAQLTIQELGTLLRYDVPAIIVVVNNDGYTVERAIHGPTKSYNDIAPWRWTELAHAFGARDGASRFLRVETAGSLVDALADAATHPRRLTLIEAVTAPLDVPPLLVAVAEAAATANAPTA